MGADGIRWTGNAPWALNARSMSCPEFDNDVGLYVDGELGDVERGALEAHLEDCRLCRRAVAFQQAFKDRLRAPMASVAPPPQLACRIQQALCREPAPLMRGPFWRRRRILRPMPMAAGATALGLTAWLWFGSSTDELVRDIVARHSRRLPLEIQGTDAGSVELWLSDKVDFRVQVPQPDGRLSLMGARLSHVRDHSAVYLLYGNPEAPHRRVSVIVYDDPRFKAPFGAQKVDDRDVHLANAAGYNVAVWKQNEVVYSLVSDGEEDVLELVRSVKRR